MLIQVRSALLAVGVLALTLTGCQAAPAEAPGASVSGSNEPGGTQAQEAVPEPAETAPVEPAAGDVDGYWCPTPESSDSYGCVTIALPNATYDGGQTFEITSIGEQYGGFAFTAPGAPFGIYYPAGIGIQLPDYYPGADLPEQDRLWNGQTSTMLLRGE